MPLQITPGRLASLFRPRSVALVRSLQAAVQRRGDIATTASPRART